VGCSNKEEIEGMNVDKSVTCGFSGIKLEHSVISSDWMKWQLYERWYHELCFGTQGHKWKMSVIGIVVPDGSICHIFWVWSQSRHFFFFRCNFRETLRLHQVCSLNLPYWCLCSLTAFHNLINMTLNNGSLCLNLHWLE